MNIVVKSNGEILNVDVLRSEIVDIIGKRKHLCGGCKALVCSTNDILASEIIKEGLRTNERYYVFECDGYDAMDASYFANRTSLNERSDNSVIRKYAGVSYSITHPNIRKRF